MAGSRYEQSMKSIVFIITTLRRTGPVNILFDLVKYLDRSVYKPHIITLCEEEGDSRWREFEADGVSLERLNLPRGWRFPMASGRIKTMMAEIQPAAIHCIGFRADLIGAIHLGQYRKVSSQLNYPFDDYVLTYGKVIGGMMAHLTTWALKRYDVTIACANDVAVKMQCKGVPARVIYNAIDDTRFVPPNAQERLAQRQYLSLWPDAKLVFIFVGTLSDRKQPLVALQAFLRFQALHPKSAMLVLGEGPLSEECKQLVDGIRVVFFGNVPDTRPYLAASDIYIATSKAEGMPVSVLEAMAMKLPILLSDIEPHREILAIDSEAGLLASTGSVDDTAQTMLKLAQKNLPSMGAHSRQIIDNALNSKVMSMRFQKIYCELTS